MILSADPRLLELGSATTGTVDAANIGRASLCGDADVATPSCGRLVVPSP